MKRALWSRTTSASGMVGTPRTYTWKPSGSTRKRTSSPAREALRANSIGSEPEIPAPHG